MDSNIIKNILVETWESVKNEVKHDLRPILYKISLDASKKNEICQDELKECINRFTDSNSGSAAGHAYSNSDYFRVNQLNDILPQLLIYYAKCKFKHIDIYEYIKEDSTRFFLNLQIFIALLNLKESNITEIEPTLPDWTKSGKGNELLNNAINDGYIIKDTYKWDCSKRGGKALLAYFIDRASDYLDLRPENDKIPWLSFSFLMNNSDDIAYLKGVVSGYKHPEHPKPEPKIGRAHV